MTDQPDNDRKYDNKPLTTQWNPVQTPGRPEEAADGRDERPGAEGEGRPAAEQAGRQEPSTDGPLPQRPGALPQQPGPQQPGPQPGQAPNDSGQLPEYWTQYTKYQDAAGGLRHDPDYQTLKSVRTKVTVANVCGPVSLIIGGVLLSTVGIVCAVLAWRSAKRLAESDSPSAPMARNFRKSALVSVVICCVAFVLNAVSVALVMPELLSVLNSGDYSQLLGAPTVDAGSGGAGDGSSAWG